MKIGLAKKDFGFSDENPKSFSCQGDACGRRGVNSAEFTPLLPAAALRHAPRVHTCAARGIFSDVHAAGKNIGIGGRSGESSIF